MALCHAVYSKRRGVVGQSCAERHSFMPQDDRDSCSIQRKWEDVMRCKMLTLATLSTATLVLIGVGIANAVDFSARFSGFQEIGGLGAGETGAIFSRGKGTLDLDLNRNARTLSFN